MTYITDIANAEIHIPSPETYLYDYITGWLKAKGCQFVDYGGWGVTESSDSIHKHDPKQVLAEPAIVVWCQQGDTVAIGTRLWYHDLNIETKAHSCACVKNTSEADLVLAILYDTLCGVNEVISRYEEVIYNNSLPQGTSRWQIDNQANTP